MTYEYITRSAEETIDLGRLIGERLKGGDIIAYKGSMGAGKTTMTRGLTLGLGLGDTAFSPTFALVNEYRGEGLTLYHFDMYRIGSALDLETTGFFDYLDDESVLAVEWSENIEEELPDERIIVTLERVDDDTRKITIDGDERFAHLSD
ncbi:MAG: tRNA (adenosine(37)-N6)-threonylcarbamoyltransferase complex ATPase subunit type 1 TsaE [Ruminococcus sp.]|nr:tRNA (adenosine(37)-N6)-threonylcarbamoyltransferase complex ATPase subunit type 1 TsaE [Ruminococcus sp.]